MRAPTGYPLRPVGGQFSHQKAGSLLLSPPSSVLTQPCALSGEGALCASALARGHFDAAVPRALGAAGTPLSSAGPATRQHLSHSAQLLAPPLSASPVGLSPLGSSLLFLAGSPASLSLLQGLHWSLIPLSLHFHLGSVCCLLKATLLLSGQILCPLTLPAVRGVLPGPSPNNSISFKSFQSVQEVFQSSHTISTYNYLGVRRGEWGQNL